MRLVNLICIFDFLTLSFIQPEELFGGTASWKPTSDTDRNTIILTQTYQWKRTIRSCSQSLTNDTRKCISKLNSCNQSNSSKWSMDSCFDLTIRSDGRINSSPVTGMISPIQIPIDVSQNITIPLIDADHDILRCRWAHNRSTIDECGDICGIVSGSSLDPNNCVLTFNSTGKKVGDLFTVVLMIEDYPNSSINTSLSSVPLQFLIEIVNTSKCSSKPGISSNLTNCTDIQVGNQFTFSLTIQSGCSSTNIFDFYTFSLVNMSQTNQTTSHVWIITQSWMPTIEQVGPHIYCAVAIDSTNQQSDPYCFKLNVVPVGKSLLCPSQIQTAASARSPKLVVVTVTVPYTEKPDSQFSQTDLALALGLGLPFTLAVIGIFICRCCCPHSTICKSIFSCQNKTLTETIDNQTELKNKSLNNTSQSTDIFNKSMENRQQYVKKTRDPQAKDPPTISNKNRPLTQKISSDFDQNSLNLSKTTFLYPSTNSLTTNDVSFTRIHSLKNLTKPKGHGSILVREYNHQEIQKAILSK